MYTASGSGSAGSLLLGFLIWAIGFAAYFAPSIVALARKVPSVGSVIVIDLLLGWTVIGWIIALAMACRSKAPRYYAPMPPPGYYPPPPQGPRQ